MNPFNNKKTARIVAIIIVAAMVITSVTALITLSVQVVYGAEPIGAKETYLNAQTESLKDFIKLVQEKYKDHVDYKMLMDGAFAGVVDVLGDPYSEYFINTEDGMNFVSAANGVYEGVGIHLEASEYGTVVVSAIPGSPAAKAGIRSGDRILRINNVAVAGKSDQEVADLIRGGVGTTVSVVISRNGAELSFNLVREVVHSPSVAYSLTQGGIGYVQISSFYEETGKEFKSARDELLKAGAKSLIVDLRDNPGGVMEAMLNVADLLMPTGVAANLVQKDVIIETLKTSGKDYKKLPVVLLINEGSASASEILAAALQDNKSATLVGTNTYGKGVGQMVMSFGNGSMLKLSTFYFLSPNKHDIDKVGVAPDFVVDIPVNPQGTTLAKDFLAFAPMAESVKPVAGDTGLNVFGAQQRLKLLGYNVKTNGVMDGATVSAVSKFQGSSGMYSYGVLDFSTMKKLDLACQEFISGANTGADTQMAKAVELLKKAA